MTDLRQSKEWAKFMQGIGWQVEAVGADPSVYPNGRDTKVFIKKIPLIGSVIKIQRSNVMPSPEELDKLAKKHHALLIKLEPSFALRATKDKPSYTLDPKPYTLSGFAADPWPLTYTKTVQIDLTRPLEEIFKDFSKDTKRTLKQLREEDFTVIEEVGPVGRSDLTKRFYTILKETGERSSFGTPSFEEFVKKIEAFEKNATLFMIEKDSKPLAGTLVLTSNGIAHGHHLASTKQARETDASYLLMWEMIKRLKKNGVKTFDLEGIYDERFPNINKDWKGFSVFKIKFGGKQVEYPQPLIKYYSPILKLISKLPFSS